MPSSTGPPRLSFRFPPASRGASCPRRASTRSRSISRENPPVRQAHLLCTGEVVTFGTPGWQGEHYGFARHRRGQPGTLDFLVASVGGCLIGTLGGALKARGIDGGGGRLTADATGEAVVDPDGVLGCAASASSTTFGPTSPSALRPTPCAGRWPRPSTSAPSSS